MNDIVDCFFIILGVEKEAQGYKFTLARPGEDKEIEGVRRFVHNQKIISLMDNEFEKLGRPTVGDSLHITMEMTHHLKVVEDSERQAIIEK